MTIQSTDRKAGPFLSGTALPIEFKVFSKEDIAVIYTNAEGVEVVLVLDSDYSVTLNTDQDNNPGGTATLTTPIVSGDRANIIGDLAYDQGTDIRNQGGFEPEIIEDALDRATIQIQQLKEISDRTLKTAPGDSRTGDELLADIFEAEENAAASAAAAEESANRVDLGALDQAVQDAQAAELGAQTAQGLAEDARDAAQLAEINAELAETNSETAEAGAEAAQAAAELARDAALLAAGVYADTVAGLAATVSGEYFTIPSSDANFALELYLNNAGVAVLQKKFLSSAFTAAAVAKANTLANEGLFDDFVGTAAPVSGAAAYASAATLIFDKPLSYDGTVYSITVSANAAGTLKIKRFTRSGTTLTFQSEISVVASTGVNTYGPDTLSALNVQQGDYIALYTPAGVLKNTTTTTDAPYFSSAGDNTTTYSIVSAAGATIRAEARIDIYGKIAGLIESQTIVEEAKSVMDERGVIFTLGATTVADQASTISTASTFFSRESNPEPGVVTQIQLYSKVVGSALLTVIEPVGDGSYALLHKYTVQLTAGVNTYSVAAGTLPVMRVPRGCLFGVLANTSASITFSNGSAAEGTYSVTGEVNGTVSALAQVYGRGLQIQAKVFSPYLVRKFNNPASRYPVDLNITLAAAIPAGARSAGFSYSAGYAQNTTTGINTAFLESLLSSNNNRMTARAIIQLRSADARVVVYRRPVLNLAGVDAGTAAEVDIANNQIILYQSWAGSTLPAIRSSLVLTTITLTQNRDYRCDLTCDEKQISFTIYDTVTGISETLAVDSDAVAAAAGFGYGAPGISVVAGTGAVNRIQLFPIEPSPKLLMLGDSITEGSGTTQPNAWANLTVDGVSGLAHVSADGGTASDAMLRRLYDALNTTPSLEYVLILIGTNDATGGAGGVTNWQTNVPLAKTLCEDYGVIPIIAHVPPRNDANQTFVDQINTFIRAQGYKTIRFDLALSVGNDGSTWNTALMADSLHPNTAGHLVMYNRVRLDVPELFD